MKDTYIVGKLLNQYQNFLIGLHKKEASVADEKCDVDTDKCNYTVQSELQVLFFKEGKHHKYKKPILLNFILI